MQSKVQSCKSAMNNFVWKITASLLLFLTLPASFVTRTLQPVIAQTQKQEYRITEVEMLYVMGLQLLNGGQWKDAIEKFHQALNITREIGSKTWESPILNYIGAAYSNLGEYAKALDHHTLALAVAKRIGNKAQEAASFSNLGIVYNNLGQHTKALESFLQALAIAKEVGDKLIEGIILSSIAGSYLNLKDYTKALEYYQQSLVIAIQTNNRTTEGASLNAIGIVYARLGQYDQSLEYYQQALAIAKEVGFKAGEGITLGSIGMVYDELGQDAKALEYYQQSLAILKEIGDKAQAANTLINMSSVFLRTGKVKEATEILRAVVEIYESLRPSLKDSYKVSIFDTQVDAYSSLQEALIVQNQIEGALEISERGRARAFVELLASRIQADTQPSRNFPTISQLKQIAKEQKATLVEYSIINERFKIQAKQEWRESALYIWVIKPTGEVNFRQADLKPLSQQQNISLKDLVTTTRNSIGVDERSIFVAEVQHRVNQEEQAKSLQQLHQLLIAPIADLLPSDPNQRVIFVPQNELFLVPFAALQDAQGKYLIEKHTILTAPSIQVLELTRQQRKRVETRNFASLQDAIVVGNPTMPSVPSKYGEKPQQLASLKGAKREAEAIAPLLNTKALTGNEATKAAVLARLPQAKIVHLATHGLFDDFQGLQSAIALAPTSSDRGLLTAEEILSLKLNADLVVLSACNTGRGRITGDGVIGLSRSLFIAGTPSVVVSLWAVPDAPTAELMTEFYTNLYQKKLDKAQSLRQAMLKMMETHRDNPRAWAAFTLIGEAE